MKCKLLSFILALTVASWAQTSATTQTPDTSNTPQTHGHCSMMASSDHADHASNNDASCCMKHDSAAKDAVESCCKGKNSDSCCNEKDGKSCPKDGKAAVACCSHENSTSACASVDGKSVCCTKRQGMHEHHELPNSGN